jgi:hypothetical protein
MISEDLRARMPWLFFAEHGKMGCIAAELGVHRHTVHHAVEASCSPLVKDVKDRARALVLNPLSGEVAR